MPYTIHTAKAKIKDASNHYRDIDVFSNNVIQEISDATDIAKKQIQILKDDWNTRTASATLDIENADMIAQTFINTNFYPAGTYVRQAITENNNKVKVKLFKLTEDHNPGINWDASSKVEVNIGNQITNLKNNSIPYPENPKSKYGTIGQTLRTLGNGKTEWIDTISPTNEQITEVISNWLDTHPEAVTATNFKTVTKIFDNVAAMIQDLTIENGTVVRTYGYYNAGDGGGTLFKISTLSETIGSIQLNNNLYANLLEPSKINVLSLGCRRNDGSDNTSIINTAILYKEANYGRVPVTFYFPAGTYAFSPLQIKANNVMFEGEGNPFSQTSRFSQTVFCPISNQDYIIMVGSSDTNKYKSNYTYHGNGIKNIQFCCNKYGTSSRSGTSNNWKMSTAMLVIYRQYMGIFSDIAFYYSYGTAMKFASSWECMFNGTLMFRGIFAPEKGALVFGTDFLSSVTISDASSTYFNNIEIESVVGNYINFERDCNFENNIFSSIMCEDYRLDMPSNSTENQWGTTWTDDTWLPTGVNAPDVELAIFNFEEGARYTNNHINNITCSMYAVRSYYFNNSLYSHTAIVKCEGMPKRFSFTCSSFDIQYNRTDIKTLIYKQIGMPRIFDFIIDSLIMSDNTYTAVLDGVARNYSVNLKRIKLPSQYKNNGMCNARDYIVSTGVHIQSEENVNIYCPLLTYNKDAISNEGICFLPPNATIYNYNVRSSPIKIPIIGNTLHVHIYQETVDTLYCGIVNMDELNDEVPVGINFQSSPAGWIWVTIDTSNYIGAYYITFANRQANVSNLVDVFYWT